jgi:hypothetical protein
MSTAFQDARLEFVWKKISKDHGPGALKNHAYKIELISKKNFGRGPSTILPQWNAIFLSLF